MVEGPDPEDTAFLAKCCRSGGIDFAHPGRRFVRLAQLWAAGAYVDSICKPDWRQAMENIAALVVDRLAPTE
jgi:hypothetical protein